MDLLLLTIIMKMNKLDKVFIIVIQFLYVLNSRFEKEPKDVFLMFFLIISFVYE